MGMGTVAGGRYQVFAQDTRFGFTALSQALRAPLENVRHEHGMPGGPMSCSFDIPGEHFIPRGMRIANKWGGAPAWMGQVASAPYDPATKRTKVTCRGIGKIMYEDVNHEALYVHNGWSGWQEFGSLFNAANSGDGGMTTSVDDQGVTRFYVPTGVSVALNRYGGVIIDAGPNQTIDRCIVKYLGGGVANMELEGWAADDILGTGPAVTTIDTQPIATGQTTYAFSPGKRVLMIRAIGKVGAITGGTTAWCRLNSIQIFGSTAYESGNASIVKVDTVASDLVANAGIPYIGTNTILIEAGTTVLEDIWTAGPENAGRLLDRANMIDRMQWRFTNDASPLLQLRAQPTFPRWSLLPGEYEIVAPRGESITDVYDSATVDWPDANGTRTQVTVTQSGTILDAVNLDRNLMIKSDRVMSTAEATQMATTELAQAKRVPLRESVQATRGFVRDYISGVPFPLALVPAGDMIELVGYRSAETGARNRRGTLEAVVYDDTNMTATFSVDSDSTIMDALAA